MSNQSITILTIFLSILSGCSLLTPPNTFLKEDFEKYHIKRVAVLPFCNKTNVKSAGKIVTRAFTEALFKQKNFEVELPGNVTKLLIEERIIIRKGIKSAHIKLIGKRLNVDAVIIGRVDEYSGDDEGRTAQTVSVHARMVHTKSCSIVWTGQNKREDDDYVIILDYGQISCTAALARKVVYELIETIP
jgi:TolB-like protein